MSGAEREPPEDPLADALAAYDDRLAAGIAKPWDREASASSSSRGTRQCGVKSRSRSPSRKP
jgi:hypothetical protein